MTQDGAIAGLGERTDFVGLVPNVDPVRRGLTDEELSLLSLVGTRAVIGEVLARSRMDPARAAQLLISLRAKGVLHVASGGRGALPHEEVELDTARQQEILEMDRRLETDHFFQLLGVPTAASADEIKTAFYGASRKFHPDRYFGKRLGSYGPRLERIFRRLSEAHQVLTDPQKRSAYLQAHPELAPVDAARADPVAQQREAERRSRLARHPYLAKASRVNEVVQRAKQHLARGDARQAAAELNLAVQMDERHPEAKALLAEARRQNDQRKADDELGKAMEAQAEGNWAAALVSFRTAFQTAPSGKAAFGIANAMIQLGQDPKEARPMAQRAVDLEPGQVEHQWLLSQVLSQLGSEALAQKHLEEAQRIDPKHPLLRKQSKKWWKF